MHVILDGLPAAYRVSFPVGGLRRREASSHLRVRLARSTDADPKRLHRGRSGAMRLLPQRDDHDDESLTGAGTPARPNKKQPKR